MKRLLSFRKLIFWLAFGFGLAMVVVITQEVAAYNSPQPVAQPSPVHPPFALLDASGNNVLQSGGPVSAAQTCGQCHDTAYIDTHAFHADLGLSDLTTAGQTASDRAWDTSPGLFGKWDPLTYRYLSPLSDPAIDLGTADWIKLNAARLVGGGPTTTSRNGQPLNLLAPGANNPEASVYDPITGQRVAWDWQKSGVLEMNCFLCHTAQPNNAARVAVIQSGGFASAATATLLGTRIVSGESGAWYYNPEAFAENGELKPEFVTIQDPTNAACAQCHGLVQTDNAPLTVDHWTTANGQTATTGQIISGQKISESGLNIANKADLSHAWDVHAERGLQCTDCHFSLNNPVLALADANPPNHLAFDPRHLELGDYLKRPNHNFARGQSAQFTVAPELKGTMRRCESCHDAAGEHAWLPYTQQHLNKVACEVCHVPQLYAPAIQSIDWTVLKAGGEPRIDYRGLEGTGNSLNDLVTGYRPLLLPRASVDGLTQLMPYNLITAWYWASDTPAGPRPVPVSTLQEAWGRHGQYAPEILSAFDANGNQMLDRAELLINTPAKEMLLVKRLTVLGVVNPRIVGEVQPYSVNHNVVGGEGATRDCQSCHIADSQVAAPIQLAGYLPGGIIPEFVKDANTVQSGRVYTAGGTLYYRPATSEQGLYIFGHDRVVWVDWLGVLAVLGVLVGATAHGGLRFVSALRQPRHRTPIKQVYMYTVYERFWHWLQTFSILLLILTGLVIHRPDLLGWLSFPHMVLVHNVLAAILILNAALSLFYHLASGEIKQYLPCPYGFFDQAIVQAKFYLKGIFQGDSHPFEKTPQKKLNPLQQVTYFGILNVLLLLQIFTGALLWGTQQWPHVASWFGGLPFLAPFHSLIAWLFAAFIIGHVYLTTTAHEPLTGLRAMILGWDEVEDLAQPVKEVSPHDHSGTTETQATELQPESVPVQSA